MVATILLLGLLLVATATDILRHRIYNWTTYSGIGAALGLNASAELLLSAGLADQRLLESLGWIGLAESFMGFLVCGFVLLVCFVLLKVGGGDVKLIAMLGAFMGPEEGITTMLWTFVLGGCVGLIVLVWRVGALRLVARTLRQILWTIRLGRWSPLLPAERAELQPPLFLAPNALLAVLLVRFSLLDLIPF